MRDVVTEKVYSNRMAENYFFGKMLAFFQKNNFPKFCSMSSQKIKKGKRKKNLKTKN